jgi:RNA polymerase sigma-70 factor (ECF subfamily)
MRQEEFEALYAAQSRYVLKLAATFVGGDDAPDVAQQVWTKAARATFDGRSQPRTWLHVITRNAARDHLRNDRRRPHGHSTDLDCAAHLIAPGVAADRQLLAQEEALTVSRALTTMGPQYRSALLMWLEDVPYADGARRLGIPLGTFKGRVSRARRQVANAVGRPLR